MLTYVLQAVDNRGNVTWLDYVSAQLPSSGVPLGVAKVVDVTISSGGTSLDVNNHGQFTSLDVLDLANFLLEAAPNPGGTLDVDEDGVVSMADLFYLLRRLFAGGPIP